MIFTVKDKTFSSGLMTAKKQFHVVRRLSPLLDGARAMLDTPTLKKLLDSRSQPDIAIADIDMAPLLHVFASLPDADFDYVADVCMDVTEIRQEGGNFAPLRVNGVQMFPLDLITVIAIVWHVLQDNLSGFFGDIGSVFQSGNAPMSNG